MNNKDNNSIMYLIAYLVPVLTGAIVYVMYGENDKRLKFYSVQSILLGIVIIVLYIIFSITSALIIMPGHYSGIIVYLYISYIFDIIITLLWLYGIYVGYKASLNVNIKIPYISNYAASITNYN